MKITKIIAATSVVLVSSLLFFFGLGYFHTTIPPKYCGRCHNTKGEQVTWEISSHSKVRCHRCHKPSTHLVFSWIANKINGDTDNLSFKDKSLASACNDCHTLNRNYTGSLKISHRGHDSRGITCIQCHPSVVHARVKDWAEISWKKSNLSFGVSRYHRPPKQVCFTCHEKEVKKETACSYCHKKLPTPSDHLQPNFLKIHGGLAEKDLKKCNSCHYAFNDQQLIKLGENIRASTYASNNIFCKLCHKFPSDKRSVELVKKR